MPSANSARMRVERDSTQALAPWAVDLAGALVSLAVSATVILSLRHVSSRGLQADLEMAGATAVLVGLAANAIVRRLKPVAGVLVLAVSTLALLSGAAQVIRIIDTRPGRHARDRAQSGQPLSFPNTSKPGHYRAGSSALGDGWGNYDGKTFRLHTQSDMSEMVSWFVSSDPGTNYYAEVTAKQVSGDTRSTACVLSFGYQQGKDWWYGLEMIDSQVVLGREEFQPPGRRLAGPRDIHSINGSGFHRLAVLREGRALTIFVDDRRFFSLSVPTKVNLDGGVTFGTLDIGSYGPGSMECQFSHPSVRKL